MKNYFNSFCTVIAFAILLVAYNPSKAFSVDSTSTSTSSTSTSLSTSSTDSTSDSSSNSTFSSTSTSVSPSMSSPTPSSGNNLKPWQVGDWIPGIDYRPSTFDAVKKAYFYNSPMALRSDVFAAPTPAGAPKLYSTPYILRNYNTTFPSGTNPGIPGPFEKVGETGSYSYWGGDVERGFGPNNYSILIEDFGTLHMSAIEEKMQVHRWAPSAPHTEQDALLQHLSNGSTQIFAWYAQLIDDNGNKITYDPQTPKGQLLALFDYLIYGTGATNGVLDVNFVLGAFQQLAASAGEGSPAAIAMQIEINRLKALAKDMLRLDGSIPIKFLSWSKLIDKHQNEVYDSYLKYKAYYNGPDKKKAEAANKASLEMLDGGRQLAFFFATFYSGVALLDIFMDDVLHDATPSVFPESLRGYRVDAVHKTLKRFWYEHVHIFNDNAKAAALNDAKALYQIKLSKFESCSNLGEIVGAVFREFDTLMRNRLLMQKLPG